MTAILYRVDELSYNSIFMWGRGMCLDLIDSLYNCTFNPIEQALVNCNLGQNILVPGIVNGRNYVTTISSLNREMTHFFCFSWLS